MVNVSELLQYQLDDAGYQLDQVLDNLRDSDLDHRATPGSMSPREMIAHLCDAYAAAIAHLEGVKYDWGSFQAPTSLEELLSAFSDLRKQAVAAVLQRGNDDAYKTASLYILAHDYYHVGQLAASRLASQPEWDAYSIYRV